MGKVFKKEIGITLIALVITIIILLILAGVGISMIIRKWWYDRKITKCSK